VPVIDVEIVGPFEDAVPFAMSLKVVAERVRLVRLSEGVRADER
jgi:hypothetical protein